MRDGAPDPPMPYRFVVPLGIALAGLAVGLSALVLVLFSPFGSDASPEPPAPAIVVPPDEPPLRAGAGAGAGELVDIVAPAASTDAPQGGVPDAPVVAGDEGCQPSDPEPLSKAQVVSYYGNPYTADMGILGEVSPETLLQRLREHAGVYDSLNGERRVQPAFHIVYATAQSDPYPDGLHLLYLDDATLREYLELACENGLLVFLDLQIGRSDAESEVEKVLPYLELPYVHVALDPEFAMPPGEVPGESIGSLDAADVNAVQALLDGFLAERDLPDKILVVHQFTEGMLTRRELLEGYPRVDLVIDMDGFGPAEIKEVKYGWYAEPAPHSGIKLFFKQDPDLMSEGDVLELGPDVIIYQ